MGTTAKILMNVSKMKITPVTKKLTASTALDHTLASANQDI